jgi:acyl-CoA synthetase (AMP-forming)/AMP-acid ligase II
MPHPIAELLRANARDRADRPALICGDVEIGWPALYRRACQVANGLRTLGVQAQDRVAFVDKNGAAFFEFFFGCALCGAVPVPISWRLTPLEMQATLTDSEAAIIFVGGEFSAHCAPMESATDRARTLISLSGHPGWLDFGAWVGAQASSDPRIEAADNAVMMQLYTSGTTGLPKGVLIGASNVACLLGNLRAAWNLRAEDTNLVCMPLFHMGGIGWALAGMCAGCTSVVVREFVPLTVLDTLQSRNVSVAFFVPAMLTLLCAVPDAADRSYKLRQIVYSGSPITQETLLTSMATFGCDFLQIYGMSETSGSFAQLEAVDHDPGGPRSHLLRSAGRPYPWVEVRVVDITGSDDQRTGEVGEIWTRSVQNVRGYWNNTSETSKLLPGDGWLRTGDGGYVDAEGYLFLTDRTKDMIISGGENVYPAEVENALASCPGIAEVAVIGVPSEKWGETVKAVVALKPNAQLGESDIIGFAKQRLAGFKCPTSVEFIHALPRGATGKVLKKDLREPYWKDKQRRIN